MARNEAQGDQPGSIYEAVMHPDTYDNQLQESGYYLNPYFLLHLLHPECFDMAVRHNVCLFNQPGITGQATGMRDWTAQGNQGIYPYSSVSNTFKYQEANACTCSSMYGPQFTASGQEAENKPNSINRTVNERFHSSTNIPQNTFTSDLADENSMIGLGQGQRMNREVEYQEINLNTRTTNSSASEAIAGTRVANEPHTADVSTSDACLTNFLEEPVIGESDLKVLWSVATSHVDN